MMESTEYLQADGLRERDMDPAYRQAEESFRSGADFLWERNDKIIAEIRSNVHLSQEEREAEYVRRYQGEILQEFDWRAGAFTGQIVGQRAADERLLVGGAGPQFGQYVVSLAGKGKGELEQIMATARRTGQLDLERAAAQVALDQNLFGLFDGWVKADPQREAALRRIRTTPGDEQLAVRTNAFKPIKAMPEELVPKREDHELEARRRAFQRMSTEDFFGRKPVRVMYGRHTREV